MDKISEFKEFVKKNPLLLTYINNNEMTWQKFYEMYDMYGEEENIWNKYLKKEPELSAVASSSGFVLGDFLSFIKNINLDTVQESVQSLQRVVGVLGDITNKKEPETPTYKPRPLYKHFDD